MSSGLTNFLKKQNMMLKQENKELRTLLQLNRQALVLSSESRKGETNMHPLISLLCQENSKLHRKINQLSIELETGMCQALISQQIAFASTEQEKYLTNQLKDKLIKMRKEVECREKKIVELTKADSDKKATQSQQVRLIEVTDLTTLAKKFKDQINQLRNQIQEKRQQVSKYKDQKQQLLKLNLILTKQINQYKLITSHQSTGSNDMGSGDLSKFLSYQKKIIQDEDDPESDEDQFKDSSQSDAGMSSNEEPSIEEPTKISKAPKLELSKVPKLQLTKAKEIQELIVQKINQDDNKKKGGVVKQEKFKKIQAEIQGLRKKVGTIMLEKIQIERENDFLKRFIKELEERNRTLCELREEVNDLSSSANYLNEHTKAGQPDTETLIDICRDVTLNPFLRKVLNGSIQLPFNSKIVSYDI